jgi:hypothetical protein
LKQNEDLIIERITGKLRHRIEPVQEGLAFSNRIGLGGQGVDTRLDLFSESACLFVHHDCDLLYVVCLLHMT